MARKKITVHRKGYTRWSDGTYVKPSTYTRNIKTKRQEWDAYIDAYDKKHAGDKRMGGSVTAELKKYGMSSPAGEYRSSLPDKQRDKIIRSLVQQGIRKGMSRHEAESSVVNRLGALEILYKRRNPSASKTIAGDKTYLMVYGTKKDKYRQTTAGKRTIRAVNQDARLKAKKPGKRKSKTGKTYYERRDNRSDRNPNRKGLRF